MLWVQPWGGGGDGGSDDRRDSHRRDTGQDRGAADEVLDHQVGPPLLYDLVPGLLVNCTQQVPKALARRATGTMAAGCRHERIRRQQRPAPT